MEINNHIYQGRVLAKSQKYPIGSNGMMKSFLYLEGDYIINGKPKTQQAKFTCFSFAENRSKIDGIFPGDVVSFAFTLSGWYKPDEKDYLGAAKCFTDPVVDSKVEIIDQTSRVMYDNRVDTPKDDLGTFADAPPINLPHKPGTEETILSNPPVYNDDDPANDLPFTWFIPLLLPLAANFLI